MKKLGISLLVLAALCLIAAPVMAGGHGGGKGSSTFQSNSAKVTQIGVGKNVAQFANVNQGNLKLGGGNTFQSNSAKVTQVGAGKNVCQGTFVDQNNVAGGGH